MTVIHSNKSQSRHLNCLESITSLVFVFCLEKLPKILLIENHSKSSVIFYHKYLHIYCHGYILSRSSSLWLFHVLFIHKYFLRVSANHFYGLLVAMFDMVGCAIWFWTYQHDAHKSDLVRLMVHAAKMQ